MPTPAEEELIRKAIPYRFFRHPGPVHSLDQAAAERGQKPEQVVRSLLFRLSEDRFVLVLVAGPKQIDWRALRRYLGENRLTTATEEEVREITGYVPGSVTPFGLPHPIRILVDARVFHPEEISIGSGERGSTLILKTADLKKALPEHEIIDIFSGVSTE